MRAPILAFRVACFGAATESPPRMVLVSRASAPVLAVVAVSCFFCTMELPLRHIQRGVVVSGPVDGAKKRHGRGQANKI